MKPTAFKTIKGRITIDSGTAQTADWNSTAWSAQGYGAVYIQVTQDITSATDTVTYTLYSSIDPVACANVTNWSVAYERVNVTKNYSGAVAPFAFTSMVTQTASVAGGKTVGLRFDTEGAWCMRIAGDVTTGRTVTTTIYVAPTDIYE